MDSGRERVGGMGIVGLIAAQAFVVVPLVGWLLLLAAPSLAWLVFLGPLLAWLRLVPALVGFSMFALGGLFAIVATIGLVVNLVRGRGADLGRVLATVAAVVFVIAALRSGNAPIINDYTTDLDSPPAFRHAATLPANQARDLAYRASFADIQRQCCADLRPLRISTSPLETLQRAQRAASQMPRWTITQVDPTNGTIEAVAESLVFGFRDDVVIRIRPDGGASIVDVRSKSRDGGGDMGVNAARIRSYLAALQSDTPPGA